jgi:hypothetical protein
MVLDMPGGDVRVLKGAAETGIVGVSVALETGFDSGAAQDEQNLACSAFSAEQEEHLTMAISLEAHPAAANQNFAGDVIRQR